MLSADCFAFNVKLFNKGMADEHGRIEKADKAVESLPNTRMGDVLGKQLLRSATSVGANYRSACRAQSKPAFISKSAIAIEEADESQYWLEMIIEAGLLSQKKLADLMKESDEIVAILTASSKTAKANLGKRISNQQSAISNQQSAIERA